MPMPRIDNDPHSFVRSIFFEASYNTSTSTAKLVDAFASYDVLYT